MKRNIFFFAAFVCSLLTSFVFHADASSNLTKCYSCHGRGINKCPICFGYGGSGAGMYYRACLFCGGNGEIVCNVCKGTGHTPDSDIDDSTLEIIQSDDYYSQGKQNAKSKHQHNGNTYHSSGGYSGGYSGGNSGSSDITCSGCGGSGRCTSCGGAGGSYEEVGYYTGSSTTKWIKCGACNGSGRCGVCRGKGKL